MGYVDDEDPLEYFPQDRSGYRRDEGRPGVDFDLGDEFVQDEKKILITEAIEFIASLEFTLTQGLPQEKLVALRQCIERIHINRSRNNIKIKVHKVPVGNLQTINELETCL